MVVIIVYWGSPSSSNIRPYGRSQTSTTYTFINAVPGYEEARQPASLFKLCLELGAQELAYGHARAASTSVDSPEAGILFTKGSSRCGDGGAPVDSP